jgi:hypothetical protein
MQLIGFSTGAIALDNFEGALNLLKQTSMSAVELSALRLPELPILVAALPLIDLEKFRYVAMHAPSRFSPEEEIGVTELLKAVPKQINIIIHPDTIHDVGNWSAFGAQLAIENMDRRKPFGRSAEELGHWFDVLPESRLCLDLAHAHQFDRTMTEAYRILRSYKDRVCQIHVSELDSAGHHFPLSFGSIKAFAEVASMIPQAAAIIIESLNPYSIDQQDVVSSWAELEAERALLALGRGGQEVAQNAAPRVFTAVNAPVAC